MAPIPTCAKTTAQAGCQWTGRTMAPTPTLPKSSGQQERNQHRQLTQLRSRHHLNAHLRNGPWHRLSGQVTCHRRALRRQQRCPGPPSGRHRAGPVGPGRSYVAVGGRSVPGPGGRWVQQSVQLGPGLVVSGVGDPLQPAMRPATAATAHTTPSPWTLTEAGVPLARIRDLRSATNDAFRQALHEVGEQLADLDRRGFTPRWVKLQRDLWILAFATHPDRAVTLFHDQADSLADPALRQLFLDYDHAYDLNADDPGPEGLAQAHRERYGPDEPPGLVAGSAIPALIQGTVNAASPAWRRLDSLIRAHLKGSTRPLPAQRIPQGCAASDPAGCASDLCRRVHCGGAPRHLLRCGPGRAGGRFHRGARRRARLICARPCRAPWLLAFTPKSSPCRTSTASLTRRADRAAEQHAAGPDGQQPSGEESAPSAAPAAIPAL